jgi:predicted DNA-binding transcriptional regulator AlpA
MDSTAVAPLTNHGSSMHDLENLPPLMTLTQTADILHVTRQHIYNMLKADAFPIRTVKLGKSHRVVTADLLRFLGAAD